VILLGVVALEYVWPGWGGERPTESGEFAYLFVFAVGYSLLCLGLLPGLANVLVVSQGGVTLERWGRLVWRIAWDNFAGWQREIDTNGNLVGLLLTDREGRTRRVGLGLITLSSSYYERILAALRQHAPDKQELPQATVFRLSPVFCLGLVVLALLLAFFLVVGLVLHW